jgi:DNA-binding MarR family transcriptional regulator
MGLEINRARALNLWHEVTLEGVRNGPDLTARQLAVLTTVYLTDPPHTVRDLSERLGTPKPAITRAVDVLSELGLVRRARDPLDRRNVFVMRTPRGSAHLTEFAKRITRAARALQA